MTVTTLLNRGKSFLHQKSTYVKDGEKVLFFPVAQLQPLADRVACNFMTLVKQIFVVVLVLNFRKDIKR